MLDKPVIVALDYPDSASALRMAKRLSPELCRLKIGKQLFTAEGPALVESVMQLGFDVFLDLKFHDIPNTVAGAVAVAARMGVWMVNVHASGGSRMMLAARESIDSVSDSKTLLTAVTVLTSMSPEDLAETGVVRSPLEQVMYLAELAEKCGMDGVVCSAQEASALRASRGSDFALVTPGIRLEGDTAGDQRRVVTPEQALLNGSTYLVMGRSITGASDPVAVLRGIKKP